MAATTADAFEAATLEPLSGVHVIEASAGTGKTFAITTLVIRLVVEQNLPIERILVVTFTEAATAELRARVRSRLRQATLAFQAAAHGERSGHGDLDAYAARRASAGIATLVAGRARLERALADVDLAPISTIHGFCRRALERAAFAGGVDFTTTLTQDLGPLETTIARDYWVRTLALAPREVAAKIVDSVGFGTVLGLVQALARTPDLRLLPASAPALDATEAPAFAAAFAAAAAAFAPERVLASLGPQGFVGPEKPGKKEREAWCDDCTALFRSPPSAAAAPPKGLARLGLDALTERYSAPLATEPFFAAATALMAAWQREQQRLAALPVAFKLGAVAYARAELAARKQRLGTLGFTDLLVGLRDALRGPRGEALGAVLREEFAAALVDEFQDTDTVQFEIFDALYRDRQRPVFFIGDPKQAIYAFRGADVHAYLRAVTTAEHGPHGMGTNWRSDPGVLAAIGALFTGSPSPFRLATIPFHAVSPRPGAAAAFCGGDEVGDAACEFLLTHRGPGALGALPLAAPEATAAVTRAVAADISRLLRGPATLAGRPITPGQVGVLVRTNAQGAAMRAALGALGIPAVVATGQSVFAADEAAELARLLAAIEAPLDAAALRRGLTTSLVGLRAAELLALETDTTAWNGWVARLRALGDDWRERGFARAARALLTTFELPQRWLAERDGERRLTNLRHLIELLGVHEQNHAAGPAALLRWLAREIAAAASDTETPDTPEATELRLETDAAAVQLTTIHKAKGLEYDVVYCPYLWGAPPGIGTESVRFHDPESGALCLDLGSDNLEAHRELAREEQLAEQLRVLYVALTRARHRLSLVWGPFKSAGSSALGHLLYDEATREHLVDAELAILRAPLDALLAAAPGAIAVRDLDLETPGVVLPATQRPATELRARRVERELHHWARTSSFSALTHEHGAAEPTPERLSATDDEDSVDAPPALTEAEGAGALAARLSAPSPLAGLPAGKDTGLCLHALLETVDFAAPVALESRAAEELDAWRVRGGAALAPMVAAALKGALATPLDASGLRLGDVPRGRRFTELPFDLPVRPPRERGRAVTARALSEVFAAHPSPALPVSYAARVAALPFLALRGLLTGVLDLAFEHGGRWHVADYKGNRLGDRLGDYTPPRLSSSMHEAHYFLQYHLYTLAVVRYLRWRVPGFEYETGFGGVYYLFLRGMTPATGPACGIFFERPPAARIDALDRLFGGGAA